MLGAAVKAIVQMFSPPLRTLLWKSIALALFLIIVVAAALYRLIVWLVGTGSNSAETAFGPYAHWQIGRASCRERVCQYV